MIEVINIKTNEVARVDPVDAAEYVATGGWKYKGRDGKKPVATDSGATVTLIHVNSATEVPVNPNKVETLLASGDFKLPGTEDEPSDGELKINMLVAAIKSLPVEQEDLWTSDGKPQTDALRDRIGDKVSAAERDQAWALVDA